MNYFLQLSPRVVRRFCRSNHGAIDFHRRPPLKEMDFHEKAQVLAAADDLALKSFQGSGSDLHPIPGLNPFLGSERLARQHQPMDANQILMHLRLVVHANAMSHLVSGQSAHPSFLVAPQEDVTGEEGRGGGKKPVSFSPALLGKRQKKTKTPTQEMPGQGLFRPR